MRMPSLLADFIHPRVYKPICAKLLTLPGFSAFFVLFLSLGRLRFSGDFRDRKAAGAWARIAAETAKSLTHP